MAMRQARVRELAAWTAVAFTVVAAVRLGAAPATPDAVPRDPFVPVGYVEPTEAPVMAPDDPTPVAVATTNAVVAPPVVTREPDWARATERLGREVSAIAELGGERVVVIAGKMASVGDQIGLSYDGFRYTWRINAMSRAEGLDLRRLQAVPK